MIAVDPVDQTQWKRQMYGIDWLDIDDEDEDEDEDDEYLTDLIWFFKLVDE